MKKILKNITISTLIIFTIVLMGCTNKKNPTAPTLPPNNPSNIKLFQNFEPNNGTIQNIFFIENHDPDYICSPRLETKNVYAGKQSLAITHENREGNFFILPATNGTTDLTDAVIISAQAYYENPDIPHGSFVIFFYDKENNRSLNIYHDEYIKNKKWVKVNFYLKNAKEEFKHIGDITKITKIRIFPENKGIYILDNINIEYEK